MSPLAQGGTSGVKLANLSSPSLCACGKEGNYFQRCALALRLARARHFRLSFVLARRQHASVPRTTY